MINIYHSVLILTVTVCWYKEYLVENRLKLQIIAISCVFLFFIVLEIIFTQFFSKKEQKPGDGWVEILSSLALILFTQPFVLFCGALLAKHRLSHSVKWLYNLHRPHHNAEYLSVRIVYRNNFFYYLLMPGLWFSGMLIYLGGGWVYAAYLIIKMTVIISAHSDVRWDEPLYKIKWLSTKVTMEISFSFGIFYLAPQKSLDAILKK